MQAPAFVRGWLRTGQAPCLPVWVRMCPERCTVLVGITVRRWKR